MKICKDGLDIHSLTLWMQYAPPKSEIHWREGRSALELARAWCEGLPEGKPPAAIVQLVEQHEPFRGATYDCFEPECKVRFDNLRGETRNSDLVGLASVGQGRIAISIEGKADEPFDLIVADRLRLAGRRIADDERTFLPQRIQELGRALLPKWTKDLPHLGDLRYQLLTGVAGALAYAKKESAIAAFFIVHEFRTTETDDDLLARNQDDLDRFIFRLSAGKVKTVPSDTLLGPFSVRGSRRISTNIPLFVGKTRRDLLAGGA